MSLHLRILSILLFSSITYATSFYIRPFSEFTQSAPNIVRGRITNVHVENGITNDGMKTIYTFANVDVKERLKGDVPGYNIVIRKVGGSKDGMTLEVPSSPVFKEGEDSVLYLSPIREDKSYEVIGLELGKFGILESHGKEVLTGGLFNFSNSPHDPHDVMSGDLSENHKVWTLQDLRALIHQQEQPTLQAGDQKSQQIQSGASPQAAPSVTPESALSQPSKQDDQANEKNYPNAPQQKPAIAYLYLVIGFVVGVGLLMVLRRKKH